MTVVPSLNYDQVVRALRRGGWVVVRQKGSHIRLHKTTMQTTMKLTIPAHKPIKRTTLHQILKQAEIPLGHFLELL